MSSICPAASAAFTQSANSLAQPAATVLPRQSTMRRSCVNLPLARISTPSSVNARSARRRIALVGQDLREAAKVEDRLVDGHRVHRRSVRIPMRRDDEDGLRARQGLAQRHEEIPRGHTIGSQRRRTVGDKDGVDQAVILQPCLIARIQERPASNVSPRAPPNPYAATAWSCQELREGLPPDYHHPSHNTGRKPCAMS